MSDDAPRRSAPARMEISTVAPKPRSRRQLSLRMFVTVALAGMVLITAGTITLISWLNARGTAETTMALMTNQAVSQTELRVRSFLQPARDVVELAAVHVSAGILQPDDPLALERYFFHALQSQPSLETLCWADADGGFLMVQRDDDQSLDTKIIRVLDPVTGERVTELTNRSPEQTTLAARPDRTPPPKKDTYQPRQRPWYKMARQFAGVVWTDAYIFHTKRIPGLTAALAVNRDDAFHGVLCADLTLRGVSDFLSELKVGNAGRAVLIDSKSRLLAAPDRRDLIEQSEDGVIRLRQAEASVLPEIAAFAVTSEWRDALERGTQGVDHVRFEHGDIPYVGSLRRVAVDDRTGWLVGAVVPEDDFLGPIHQANAANVLTSVVLLLVAFIISLFIARRVSRSLSTLVAEAREISRLRFADHPGVDSPFREVNAVLDAFDNMKVGLRSFQKYLPLKLVRRLLANQEEPELGGEFMELTIYFSDIADFTPINESMHPMDMAKRLGSYLAALTDEIESRQGTVVQYVGDEIMALWGAPQPVADHAVHACRAALACAERVEHLWDDETEIPTFTTRFGIHTAEVAVGHFGSTERLYYGAIGDGINTTSRLEGLNKYYGTTALISDTTWGLVEGKFHVRRIDKVAVKGKTRPLTVYELLGEIGQGPSVETDWLGRWESAFSRYLERGFDTAAAQFEALAAERPHDRPARLLAERCHQFTQSPPHEAWDGVHRMQTK